MLDRKFWQKYFEVYDALNELIPYQELSDKIIENLDLKAGDRVLDLGSGTGNIAVRVGKKGVQVTGIDFSREGTEIHKAKSPSSEVLEGDITRELPFSDNYFNKVYSNNVLYTISEDKRLFLFKELYRVMKEDGIIVLSNPKAGYKPVLIYFDHIKKQIKRDGLLRTLKKIISYIIPTIQIFSYNARIKKEGELGQYKFMGLDDQRTYLSQAGFREISDNMSAYASQSVLNVAKK